jgi:ATP-binding cassette, subfamily C, bacteriocin exporter
MRKSIRVKQHDISDCGAACLVSVAAYYDLHVPVSMIRQYADTAKRGTTLSGLITAAGKLNFIARGAKAANGDLNGIPIPAVFHLVIEDRLQHFVVVYKIGKNYVWVMDPACGKLIKLSLNEFKKSWTGVVMLLMPSGSFREGNRKVSIASRFWELILPHKKMLFRALLGAFVYTAIGLSTSVYIQKIVDLVLPGANKNLMNVLTISMVALLCFQTLAGYFKSLIILKTGREIDSWLILGYYRHLLKLPQRFFDNMRVGEIISRVNDAVRIRLFINDISIGVVIHAFTMILCLSVMFLFYWKLALIMLVSIPIYALIYQTNDRINSKWQRKMMETGAAFESQLVESIQGIATIRRFGTSDFFNMKTENSFVPYMRAIFTSSRSGIVLANLSELITGILTISILWVGSYLVIDHIFSSGELISFYTLIIFFTNPVRALIGANRSMQDAIIAADRLFEIIDLETETDTAECCPVSTLPSGDLIFEHVKFSYGRGPMIFNDIQLRIPQFKVTAVIGDSGCGKSTMLSLIQKIYSPQDGIIKIGEMDIQNISNSIIRQGIAAVPQHTDIFQGTILSNIALGENEPDEGKVIEICTRLGLHEFIMNLPSRYQTIINEQGVNLSGGQKQRLGIARAIYRNPAILILDEATSALDPENENKVQEVLQWFQNRQKTILVITHRLKTVLYCDTVIFLRKGKPVLTGTHQTLLLENSIYAEWWNK